MTLPVERARAIIRMEQCVLELADLLRNSHKESKRVLVPKEKLKSLLATLRHYPTAYDVKQLSLVCPDILDIGDKDDA